MFDELLKWAVAKGPVRYLGFIEGVGPAVAFLARDVANPFACDAIYAEAGNDNSPTAE